MLATRAARLVRTSRAPAFVGRAASTCVGRSAVVGAARAVRAFPLASPAPLPLSSAVRSLSTGSKGAGVVEVTDDAEYSQALASKGLCVVYFTASWCAACAPPPAPPPPPSPPPLSPPSPSPPLPSPPPPSPPPPTPPPPAELPRPLRRCEHHPLSVLPRHRSDFAVELSDPYSQVCNLVCKVRHSLRASDIGHVYTESARDFAGCAAAYDPSAESGLNRRRIN